MSGVILRRPEVEDVKDFTTLVNSQGGQSLYRAMFGTYSYSALIETSYLSLIAYSSDSQNCLGFVAFDDANTVTKDFEPSINALSQLIPANVTNTLFVSFLAMDQLGTDCSSDIMYSTFEALPAVDFLVWVCPSSARAPEYMSRLMPELDLTARTSTTGVDPFKNCRCFCASRENFLPKLLVREARVEDNDDLLPILVSNKSGLDISSDPFFLVNLIENQDHRNKLIVGVSSGTNLPVGLLATSMDVKVDMIQGIFNLESYSDLIVTPVYTPPDLSMTVFVGGDTDDFQMPIINSMLGAVGCRVLDARKTLVDVEDAQSAVEAINLAIQAELTAELETKTKACVVFNFPRNAAEAEAMRLSKLSVDLFLDFKLDEDEEGLIREDLSSEVGVAHREGMAIMRELFTGEDSRELGEGGYPDENDEVVETSLVLNGDWRQVIMGSGSSMASKGETLQAHLITTFEQRIEEIESILGKPDLTPYGNAFMVSLFSLLDEHASRAEDLLRIAFEENASVDYCLFLVPNGAKPSALCRCLSLVQPRDGVSFDHSLYIVRRDSLLANQSLQVVRCLPRHIEDVEAFLGPMGSDNVLAAVKSALKDNDVNLKDNPGQVCFVTMLDNAPVAVTVLTRKLCSSEDVSWLSANYQIEAFINMEKHRARSQAFVTEFVSNPMFKHWGRFILREIMRQYGKTILYYQNSSSASTCSEIASTMIPVRPRRRQEPRMLDDLGTEVEKIVLAERPSESPFTREDPLYFMSKRNLTEPRLSLTCRVVVVGGDNAALSLIESLAFVPHLHLHNIALVTENPPAPWTGGSMSGELSPRDPDDAVNQELKALGFCGKVSLVRGRLTDIDRAAKAVVISDELAIEYDILIIASGVQDATSRRIAELKGAHPSQLAGRGVHSLGTPGSDMAAIEWVLGTNAQVENGPAPRRRDNTVVYGSGIDAWAAVGGLLQNGVSPETITWLVDGTDGPGELGYEAIDEVAMKSLQFMPELAVVEKVDVTSVLMNENDEVTEVVYTVPYIDLADEDPGMDEEELEAKRKIRNKGLELIKRNGQEFEVRHVRCDALLLCTSKRCDVDTFAAVNDAGLIYDGGIVVNENFQTVDPAIYAVGAVTRFSRIHKNAPDHARFNSREVGAFVAGRILEQNLEPHISAAHANKAVGNVAGDEELKEADGMRAHPLTSQATSRAMQSTSVLLPSFSLPKTACCRLPGGLYYARSLLPTADAGDGANCTAMTTGGPGDPRVMTLKIDYYGIVFDLVYIGELPVEQRNLGRFVGWHESFLNSAKYSFDMGEVNDWTTFFKEDWATVICHDNFPTLVETLRDALSTDKGMFYILDKLSDVTETTAEMGIIAKAREDIIGCRGANVPIMTRKNVETLALEFLRRNQNLFQSFYIPSNTGYKKAQ